MSNLDQHAFPFYEPGGTDGSISTGFTKHELATILIAANLSVVSQNAHTVADIAYDLAKAVLGKFENKDGSNIG